MNNDTFDYYADITDMTLDESIIPALRECLSEFDKQAHKALYGYWLSSLNTLNNVVDSTNTGCVPLE